MQRRHFPWHIGISPRAEAAAALSGLFLAASTALAQAPTASPRSPSEGRREIVLWAPRPPARQPPAAIRGLPSLLHLRLEVPTLLGMRPLLRIGLSYELAPELAMSQTLPWYPPLRLRAVPTERSTRQAGGAATPDHFAFLDERFNVVPVSMPWVFAPTESSFSAGFDAQFLARAFTVVQSWDPRPGFALAPVPQGLLGGMLITSPSAYDRLGEQSQIIDGASFSLDRGDGSRPIAPDFARASEPF